MSLEGKASGQTLYGSINKCDLLTISAYGIAVKNGYEGTEEEWLASLKGDKGDKGEKGDIGYVDGEPITAEMVGARPDTWLPTIAEIGAAPGGYGLGGMGAECNTFNGTIKTGVYSMAGDACIDYPAEYHFFRWGVLFVENRWNVLIKQTLFYHGISAIRYSMDGGATWTPLEFINPPMELGVEYRTTERYNGKPVYRKAINVGAMPNAAIARIPNTIGTTIDFAFPIEGCLIHSQGNNIVSFPYVESTTNFVSASLQLDNIVIAASGNSSAFNGVVYLKFTKK